MDTYHRRQLIALPVVLLVVFVVTVARGDYAIGTVVWIITGAVAVTLFLALIRFLGLDRPQQ